MFFTTSGVSLAQQNQTEEPIYIVQEGDSLWDIALRFRVSMADLSAANGITDPNQLKVGARLIIPGLEGIQGILTTETVAFGDTLLSLSRRYQTPVETLVRLNHLTSPEELYAGTTLVVSQQENLPATERYLLQPGQSLLEMAVAHGVNPWSFVTANHLSGTWNAVPGDILHLPTTDGKAKNTGGPSGLPEAIIGITLKPSPLVQGKVAVMRITGEPGLEFSGSLNGKQLHFFPVAPGDYISLQGIHAMTEPGLYSLVLTGTLPSETQAVKVQFNFSQAVSIHAGGYPFDPPLKVDPATIDPAVTKPEDAQWNALAAPITPEKLWDGIFKSPAPPPYNECFTSRFGDRRSYNGSAYTYFHSGLDFCGGVGVEIRAPAAGIVVFAGPLTVRGNATMINHGWGIYTGYMHQSEIRVKVGDIVSPGQVIGLVGGTGRVTGPHLHWEVWAGGVQVNPLDWLQEVFP
jgi:murein DD-endopeptidase MepM/ murein hydrolase activator NlpD